MTDQQSDQPDPKREEIARNERWLRDHLVDLPTPNVDTVKKHVRIAIQEQWLEQAMRDDCPTALAHRIKAATCAALCEESPVVAGLPASRSVAVARSGGRRTWAMFAVWGMAAAACFAIYVGVIPTNHDGRDAWSDASQYDPFFTSTEKDDIQVLLTELRAGIVEAEALLDEYASLDAVDASLDDLMFQMDRVLANDHWSS